MNNDHINKIQKEDKKAFKSYIAMVIICGTIGAIFGLLFSNMKHFINYNFENSLMNILQIITPFASIILSVLVVIISKIIYNKSKREYNLWTKTDEDEQVIEKIETRLSYVLLITCVNMILGFFFFGTGSMTQVFDKINSGFSPDFNFMNFICLILGFILCIVTSTLIQKKIINFKKEINPLLKGSIYDLRFSQKWLESCDEAIKLGIFKSAYKSYKVVSTTCVILWIFCFVGYEFWNFGIMPMVMVIIIWLVQVISYSIYSIKQLKSK